MFHSPASNPSADHTLANDLTFVVLGCKVRVHCDNTEAQLLLLANYGSMCRELDVADLNYGIYKPPRTSTFYIARNHGETLEGCGPGGFLFLFEKDLTIELQKLRRDLYFVHSAVLEFQDQGLMLVAESGQGKSTTTWELLHHGFRYLSDELGPVNLESLTVQSYPRALCLKTRPPGFHRLPRGTVYTSQGYHIPVEKLPSGVRHEAVPVSAIFFVHYRPELVASQVEPIRRAEAGARLLAHALNPLAHAASGLDGAIEISRRAAPFKLFTANLSAIPGLIGASLSGLS